MRRKGYRSCREVGYGGGFLGAGREAKGVLGGCWGVIGVVERKFRYRGPPLRTVRRIGYFWIVTPCFPV